MIQSQDVGPAERVWKNVITDKGWVHHKAVWPLSAFWGFYRGSLGRGQRGWPLKVVLLLGFSYTSWLRVHVAQKLASASWPGAGEDGVGQEQVRERGD